MIKPNFSIPDSAETNREQMRRPVSLILVAIIAVVGLTSLVVTQPLIGQTVVADQPAQLENVIGPMELSEVAYLIGRLLPDDPYGQETGRVRVVNLKTGEVVTTIETGGQPDVAVSPDRRRLYLAAFEEIGGVSEDKLTAFDTATWQVVWKTNIEGSSLTDWAESSTLGIMGPLHLSFHQMVANYWSTNMPATILGSSR